MVITIKLYIKYIYLQMIVSSRKISWVVICSLVI